MNNKLYIGDNGEELTPQELWSRCEEVIKPLKEAKIPYCIGQVKIDGVMYRHNKYGNGSDDEYYIALDKGLLNSLSKRHKEVRHANKKATIGS